MEKEIRGLKRQVKRAKSVEVGKLVKIIKRRIKKLEDWNGTEDELEKYEEELEGFEKELEILKDADLDEIIHRITNKQSEVSCDDLRKEAIDRVVKNAKIQEFLKMRAAEEEDPSRAGQRNSDAHAPPRKKQRKNVKNKQKKAKTERSSASSEQQPKGDDEDNAKSDEEVQRQQIVPKQKDSINTNFSSDINPES